MQILHGGNGYSLIDGGGFAFFFRALPPLNVNCVQDCVPVVAFSFGRRGTAMCVEVNVADLMKLIRKIEHPQCIDVKCKAPIVVMPSL